MNIEVLLTEAEIADEFAEAMEARGFGSGPRTYVDPPRLQRRDWLVTAAAATAVFLFWLSAAAGWAAPWAAYPTLSAPDIDIRPLVACLLLLAPVLAWRSRS